MSELRRNGGADDADNPIANDNAADKPAERPRLEIRTADMDPERPVNRPLVTKAQRYYTDLVKQSGDAPPPGDTEVVYVKDWATGESLDHKYPPITGGTDRTGPDDPPGEAVRDNGREAGPSVSTPEPPTLQQTNATGVERLRDTDAASHDDQQVRDNDRIDPDDHNDPAAPDDPPGEPDPYGNGPNMPTGIPDLRTPSTKPDVGLADESHRAARLPGPGDRPPVSELDADKPEVPEAADPADRFSDLTVRKRRGDRIASELAEKADDVVEHVGDVFKTFEDLAGPRPPGHAEIQCKATPPPWAQPVATSATHSGVDIVMAIAAGGLAAAEAGRRMRDRVHDWREHRAGNG